MDFIIELFCRIDDRMQDVPKHNQAKLYPSEIVTLGMLFALKGVGDRAFYRWVKLDWTALFPNLPDRTRLFRLFSEHQDWTNRFLAEPSLIGVADTYGLELLHPMREGRSPDQIGKKGKSNHRWIVGGKLAFVLNHVGLIVDWDRGTERHIQEDIQRLSRNGYGVFHLRPAVRRPTHAVLGHPAIKSLPNLPAFAMADVDAMRDAMLELGITEIHTYSLVDFVPESPDHVVELVKSLGARFEVNLHDYKVACPRVNVADEHGRYCGEPGEQECDRCLSTRGSDFGVQDIRAWRAMHHRVLLAADAVLVPGQDGAERLARCCTR